MTTTFQAGDAKLWRRLLLLAVVGAVPVFLVALVLIQRVYGDGIAFAEQERRGVAFLRPLARLLELVPRHQAAAHEAAAGQPEAAARLAELQARLGETVTAVADNHTGELGRRLRFTHADLASRAGPPARLAALQSRWARWQTQPTAGDPADELLASVRAMMVHAGDQSNLILDPDLDSYYLMDVVLNALPRRQHRLGVQLGHATALLSAGRLDEARPRFADVASRLWDSWTLEPDPVGGGIETALREDQHFNGTSATLQARMPAAAAVHRQADEAARAALHRLAAGRGDPAADLAAAWAAHEAGARLWEVAADELDRLLEIRIAALDDRRRRAYAILAGTLVLALAGMAWIIAGLLRHRYAELLATQEELRAKEARLRLLGDNLPDSMVYQVVQEPDATMRFHYVSAGVGRIHGVAADEVLRNSRLLHDQILPEDRPTVALAHQDSLRTMRPFSVTARMRRPDGQVRWVRLSSQPRRLADGRTLWDGIETDVTAQQRTEDELNRLNRALRTISQCNMVLVRAGTEDELLASLCRVLVETGGYQLAWVGVPEHDEAKSVRVAAHQGLSREVIDSLRLSWADNERGRGPTGTALRTGRPAMTRDFQDRTQPEDWRAVGRQYGLNSGLALPLLHREVVAGVLTLYSAAVDAFDAHEVALMQELAGDLAFGLQVLRSRLAHRQAEAALASSEALLRQFVRHTPAAVAMFDTDMRYLQASERWLTDYRLPPESVIGRSHYEVFPDIPERWKAIHRRALAGSIERCDEDPFPRADGSMEWLQWEIRPWRRPGGEIGGLIMFTQVITERKRTEQRLADQVAELRRWQELTVGREERQMQLKREINELRRRLGEPPAYPSQAGGPAVLTGPAGGRP